jgi:mono/diheme cytochrome c family protein
MPPPRARAARPRKRAPWVLPATLAVGLLAVLALLATPAAAQMMGGGRMGGGMMGRGGMMGGPANRIPASPESLADGRAVYVANCAACHGADARGDGPAAGAFQPPPADLLLAVRMRPPGLLFQAVTDGLRRMPAFGPTLSAAERWDVINYLESLGR